MIKLDKIKINSAKGQINLRPVKIINGPHTDKIGFFHRWGRFSDKGEAITFAIVEFANGQCDCLDPYAIQFTDREEKQNG